jgi:hypothetical protein
VLASWPRHSCRRNGPRPPRNTSFATWRCIIVIMNTIHVDTSNALLLLTAGQQQATNSAARCRQGGQGLSEKRTDSAYCAMWICVCRKRSFLSLCKGGRCFSMAHMFYLTVCDGASSHTHVICRNRLGHHKLFAIPFCQCITRSK